MALAGLSLLTGLGSFWSMRALSADTKELAQTALPSIERLGSMRQRLAELTRTQIRLLNQELNRPEREALVGQFYEARQRYRAAVASYEEVGRDADSTALYTTYQECIQLWAQANDDFMAANAELLEGDILSPSSLLSELQRFRGDHLALSEKVSHQLIHGEDFEGGHDANACNFGRWINGLETHNATLAAEIERVRPHHEALHDAVAEIRRRGAAGDREGAEKVALERFDPGVRAYLKLNESLQAEVLKARDTFERMNTMALGTIGQREKAAMEAMEALVEHTNLEGTEVTGHAEAFAEKAGAVTIAVAISAFAMAGFLGVTISLDVNRALAKVNRLARRVASGDLRETLDFKRNDEIGNMAQELNAMVHNLRSAVDAAGSIARGDLTVEVAPRSEHDALGKALQAMIRKLRVVVGEVVQAASNIATGSSQLQASSERLSSGAAEQAASAQQTSSSMESISETIDRNTRDAANTRSMAERAASETERCRNIVARTAESMADIASKISQVGEIARKTDLLALNAAIEAARAGESGRGFSVVALEVRKLAERSQQTAASIDTVSKEAMAHSSEAGRNLEELVPEVRQTAQLVQAIHNASGHQNERAGEINRAIQELDKVIQENSAASEEIAATATELSSQADALRQVVNFFRLGGSTMGTAGSAEPDADDFDASCTTVDFDDASDAGAFKAVGRGGFKAPESGWGGVYSSGASRPPGSRGRHRP